MTMPIEIRKEGGIVINNPGQIMFIPQKANGADDWMNALMNTARIVSVTISNSRTKTDILDGNSFYPAADRTTAIAGTVAIEFATIDEPIWAMAAGSGMVEEKVGRMKFINKEFTVKTNKIVISKKSIVDGAILVIGTDGTAFTKSATEVPTKGQFYIDPSATGTATTLEFNEADDGATVRVTMDYEVNTIGFNIDRKSMPNNKFVVNYQSTDLNGRTTYDNNIIVSQLSIGADMADNLQKDPSQTKTLTFNMYAPKAGEVPYEFKREVLKPTA